MTASSGNPSSVTMMSTSFNSANELRPIVPHLVWSATKTTVRAPRMKQRFVSDSARFGAVSPAAGSMP